MPKSITLGWKEYQELLKAQADAEQRAEEYAQELEELERQLKRKDKDVTHTETYRKLYAEYAKVRDIVKVQKELQAAVEASAQQVRQAESRANATAKERDALAELLAHARWVAEDFARRSRPHGAVPGWLTVKDVLARKEKEAKNGRTWTVQGYID
jgi:chromosome segregation ATPase